MKCWRRFSYLVLMDPAPTAVELNADMDFWIASSCASLSAACNYKNISDIFKLHYLWNTAVLTSSGGLERSKEVIYISAAKSYALWHSASSTLCRRKISQQNFISCGRYIKDKKMVTSIMLHLKTTFHKIQLQMGSQIISARFHCFFTK